MKYIVRIFLFNTFALWLTSQIIPGVVIPNAWQPMLWVGFILSILMLIVKPILSILFIPINIMTFGLVSWLINVIVIYLLTILEPMIQIQPWDFGGATYGGFVIPPFHITYIVSLIIATFVLTFFTNIFHRMSEH